jgi:uncharacterized membrane protein YeaQ/YmgE (transglycosylase-associated protein family)
MLSMPRIVRPDLFRFHRKEIGFPVTREPIAPLGRTKNCATFRPGNQPVKRTTAVDRTARLTSFGSLIRIALHMDFSSHSIVWILVIGLVVGAIAKLLMPGKDPGGCIITILLGIAGAFVASYLGQALGWYQPGQPAGFIGSVVGAMILLLLYRFLFRRGA